MQMTGVGSDLNYSITLKTNKTGNKSFKKGRPNETIKKSSRDDETMFDRDSASVGVDSHRPLAAPGETLKEVSFDLTKTQNGFQSLKADNTAKRVSFANQQHSI